MRKQFSTDRLCTVFWGICILCSLFWIIYINVFCSEKIMLDFDTLTIIGSAKEMYRQKSIFLHDWSYQSTMLIDSPEPITAFFLLFTSNIFLAQGIANTLCLIAVLYLMFRICKSVQMSTNSTMFSMALFLFPWGFEYLGYQYCLLLNTACYIVRVIIILGIIYGYLVCQKPLTWKGFFYLSCVTAAVYLSTFSSGLHTYIISCFPLAFFEIVKCLECEEYQITKAVESKNLRYWFILTFAMIIGIITKSVAGYANEGTNDFIPITEFFDNIKNSILALLYLLHVMPNEETAVVSTAGMVYLIRFMLLIIMMIAVFYHACTSRKKEAKCDDFKLLMICYIMVSILVLFFTKTTYGGMFFEYRYHIFTLVPIYILSGNMYDVLTILYKKNSFVRACFYVMPVVLAGISWNSYASYTKEAGAMSDVHYKSVIDSQDVSTVIVYNDPFLERLLNAIDLNHKYVDLRADFETTGWGTSYSGYEHENLENKIIFISNGYDDVLEDYYGDVDLLLEDGDTYIYLIDNQKLDFVSALPYSNEAIGNAYLQVKGNSTSRVCTDYPYSKGLSINEECAHIDNNGFLEVFGNNEVALESPSGRLKSGIYKISVICHEISGEAYLQVKRKNNDIVIGQYKIENDGLNEFSFESNDIEDFCYSIFTKSGSFLIESITISAY